MDKIEKHDKDENLVLDKEELGTFLIDFFENFGINVDFNKEQIDACFKEIDESGDGKVQPGEMRVFVDKYIRVLCDAFERVKEF